MKKFLFISMILVLILIPTFAFADMSAPGFVVYSGYISNPYGAPYYNTDNDDAQSVGTIPFQTKIICHYSYGTSYRLAFVLENEDFSYESNSTKYIDKYNVTIEDLTKYKLGESENVRTFENVIIYDLPTDATEGKVLGMIPKETDITVQPYQVDEESTGLWNEWSKWYYTSYNNINGWIKVEDFAFYNDADEYEYITAKNLLTNAGSFVPMFTPIKENYKYGGEEFDKSVFYYNEEFVEYNNEEDVARKVEADDDDYTYEVLFDGVSLYEQANVKSNKVVDSLPIGTTLSAEYIIFGRAFDTWMCVRYEGSRAWMYVGNLYSYRNKEVAQNHYAENEKTLAEAKANGWDWVESANYPTDDAALKKYYDKCVADGLIYAKEPIKESDATKKVDDIKIEDNTGSEQSIDVLPDAVTGFIPKEKLGGPGLASSQLIGIIVGLLVVILVLVITMVVVIILVNKKRN